MRFPGFSLFVIPLLFAPALANAQHGKKKAPSAAFLATQAGFPDAQTPSSGAVAVQSPVAGSASAGTQAAAETSAKPSDITPEQLKLLSVAQPEIKLADGRLLSDARVASFDRKHLSFCISHRNGIEGSVPWEIMPAVWQSAFPLSDAEKIAVQQAIRKRDLINFGAPIPKTANAGKIIVARDGSQPAPKAAPTPDTRSNLERKMENELDRRRLDRGTGL